MVRAVLLGLLATATLSCKGSGPESPVVQAGAKVGTVVEITGKVTATRSGATRDLATAGEVSGDDVVTTAADAKVVIELVHNNARWSLGGGKSGRVSESVAWGLPKSDHPAVAVDEDTSAAGRHAERAAADTAASTSENRALVPPSAGSSAVPVTKGAPGGGVQGGNGDTKKPDPTAGGDMGGLGTGGTGKGGGGGGNGIGLGTIGTIGHGGGTGTGQGYGAGAGSLGGKGTHAPSVVGGTAEVSGGLDPAIIKRVVRQHFNQLRFCYEQQLVKNPTLEGRLVIKFVIDAKGKVATATATGIDPEIEKCVAARVLAFAFPAPQGGGIVKISYPMVFKPE